MKIILLLLYQYHIKMNFNFNINENIILKSDATMYILLSMQYKRVYIHNYNFYPFLHNYA
jgi:ribonucleotide reductase beta subunit family protein with ferritin-like domain